MLRSFMIGVVLLVLSLCIMRVELGGRPLYTHLYDIWVSPTVREKVELVQHEVPQKLKELPEQLPRELPAMPKMPALPNMPWTEAQHAPADEAPVKRRHPRPAASRGPETKERHSDTDRKALDALMHKVQ